MTVMLAACHLSRLGYLGGTTSLRCRYGRRCFDRRFLARLPPETDLLRHITTHCRIRRCSHGIVGLQTIAHAIFGRRQTVGGKMPSQRLVGFAVDHRDDHVGICQRLPRGDRGSKFSSSFLGEKFGRRSRKTDQRVMHRLQEGRDILGRGARIRVGQPCHCQFGSKLDSVGSFISQFELPFEKGGVARKS